MISRRAFLGVGGAIPLIISAKAYGLEGPGANDRVNVGLIGLGGRCQEIAKTCMGIPRIRIAAICDCFKPRVDTWMAVMPEGQHWKGYTDFREMIDKEDLDAVMVETTTHARAWVACHAMAAGLDVYIEKPMCLTIAEGRAMVAIARKYERVTQVGTQQRSIPLNNWASDLVKNGTIGKIKAVYAPNFFGPVHWQDQPGEELPLGGSAEWWDIWCNQTTPRPYHKELHRNWGKWWDYDGGGLSFGVTGWGTHSYDQIQRGLGTDTTGPIEVVLEEAVADRGTGTFEDREIGPEETGAPYYHMAKPGFGPRAKVRMKYATGTELLLHLDGDRGPGLGCRFEGESGSIEINRDRISASLPEILDKPDCPATLQVPETQPHIENWIECIQTRSRCNADIEFGQRSSSLCYLVNIAREVGQVGAVLQWNPDTERFTNNDAANALLSRPRRPGYELPA
ncbi:MAG: hypothetical protein AMXMBFR84_32350 [Candidatus Hydrogenedentota bacterium]